MVPVQPASAQAATAKLEINSQEGGSVRIDRPFRGRKMSTATGYPRLRRDARGFSFNTD